MSKITMRSMLEAGVHFGHSTRFWNPQMLPYIYGKRNGIHIINLEKTLPLLNEALNFISKTIANKGTVLFVGTKRAASEVMREEAERCSMPCVDHRWLGGMLTNYRTIKKSLDRLKSLDEMQRNGTFDKMIKKEALTLRRQLLRLEQSLGGIKRMAGLPEALFVVDVGYENIAVREANRLRIPVIGIVDSNSSIEGIDYLIPGNDDAMRAIKLYASAVADAVLAGHQLSRQAEQVATPEKKAKSAYKGNRPTERASKEKTSSKVAKTTVADQQSTIQ